MQADTCLEQPTLESMHKEPAAPDEEDHNEPVERNEEPGLEWRSYTAVIYEDNEKQKEDSECDGSENCSQFIKPRFCIPGTIETEEKKENEPIHANCKHWKEQIGFCYVGDPAGSYPEEEVYDPRQIYG